MTTINAVLRLIEGIRNELACRVDNGEITEDEAYETICRFREGLLKMPDAEILLLDTIVNAKEHLV